MHIYHLHMRAHDDNNVSLQPRTQYVQEIMIIYVYACKKKEEE